MPLDKQLLEVLVCPADHGALREDADHLICGHCGRRYPVRDGRPVMLIEEAERPAP